MKIVAILASYNERRFIRACLEHYLAEGIYVYLLDNESTDETVEIAKEFLNKNVIAIETIKREGVYHWSKILKRKEEIADSLQADWFIHADPDEIRIAPSSDKTLAEAIEEVDRLGYNAINFMEYTFLPVRESQDHDHSNFQDTMKWYYPFAPRHPHRLNAWKKQSRKTNGFISSFIEFKRNRRWRTPSIDLHSDGGHLVHFSGLKVYPTDFKLKHYILLSLNHAVEKYVEKEFATAEIAGSHGWRATACKHDFMIPRASQMRRYTSDDQLDPSDPLVEHLLVSPEALR